LTICITFSNKLERQLHRQTIRNGRTWRHRETECVDMLMNKLWKSVLNMQTYYHKAVYSPTLKKKKPSVFNKLCSMVILITITFGT
jgi:hypothetical protein